MKKLLIIILIFSSAHLFSQEKFKKFDYQFGSGISLFEIEAIYICFENELNYKLNNYLSGSISLNYGKTMKNEREYFSSYRQGNLNLFISPFKNNKKNIFKIGTGLSYVDASIFKKTIIEDYYQKYSYVYFLKKENIFGLNMILYYNYLIKEKYLLGIKTYVQILEKDNVKSGIFLKLGVVL